MRVGLCILGLLCCVDAAWEKDIKRLQRKRREAQALAKSAREWDRYAARRAEAGGKKELIATAHPALVAAFEQAGTLEPAHILATLEAVKEGKAPPLLARSSKAAAAPLARAGPELSRLGGRYSDKKECKEYYTGTCYVEESCSGTSDDCGKDEFCNHDPAGNDDDGRFSYCGGGGGDCESCDPMNSVEDCWSTGLKKYGVKDCISCCLKPKATPGSCKGCHNEATFTDCLECEDGYEIVVMYTDCTGMCIKSKSVKDYTALGLGTLTTSACVANVKCYEDRSFIESLSTKGEVYCFQDDGLDDDDGIEPGCDDQFDTYFECMLNAGDLIIEIDDGDDEGPCSDDDDDEINDDFTNQPSCARAESSDTWTDVCDHPDTCKNEWDSYIECAGNFLLEEAGLDDCDIMCPNEDDDDYPWDAVKCPGTEPGAYCDCGDDCENYPENCGCDEAAAASCCDYDDEDDIPKDAVKCPDTEPGISYCDCRSDCEFVPGNCACDEAAASSCCDYPKKCEDNMDWHKKNQADEGKDCKWVARNKKKRCDAKGIVDGTRGTVKAKYACNKACGTPCRDSKTWFTSSNPKRNCLWVANDPKGRCEKEGGFTGPVAPDDDDTPAYAACPGACDGYPF